MCFIFSVTQRIFGQYVLYVMRRYDLRRQSHRRNWGNKTILTQVFLQSTQKKMKQLTNLIMLDKILPAQFHMLYREWTRDCSVSEYSQSKQCDKRWQTIIKHAEAGMLRDWQVNNGRTPRYDKFWDLVNRYLEEMQAVDDPRHSHSNEDGLVVTNMAVAISTPDLYKKCKEAAIASGFGEDEILALPTFKFQFWPKDHFTHSAMNYTGKVKVKYMVQQRNIRKSHDDEHYCLQILANTCLNRV